MNVRGDFIVISDLRVDGEGVYRPHRVTINRTFVECVVDLEREDTVMAWDGRTKGLLPLYEIHMAISGARFVVLQDDAERTGMWAS